MIADRKGSTIGIRAYNSIGRQMKLCLYAGLSVVRLAHSMRAEVFRTYETSDEATALFLSHVADEFGVACDAVIEQTRCRIVFLRQPINAT